MLPRGQAWQDCISLCVSIRLRELCGISALAWLGYLLDRACTEAVAPCDGEWISKGDSILHLDLLLPHFSHLPKWHQLFYPIWRSQDNFSTAYHKQASPRYVCLCSWQNNTGIRPYYWVHLMVCHRSPVIWSRTGQLRCRTCRCMLQKFRIRIWWFGFFLFVWLAFQVGFLFVLIVRFWSASFVPQLSVYKLL